MLISSTIASGTVAGLAAYFLGLSSLEPILENEDPATRVKNLKEYIETTMSFSKGEDDKTRSLWNGANPEQCPHADPPPGTGDGDEVPCGETSSNDGHNVVAIPGCFLTT